MQPTELTIEQRKEIYTQNSAEAAEAAMIDFNSLRDAGFDAEQALKLVIAWHGARG